MQAAPFNDPDFKESFAADELAATWERTGKGKKLWKPGDKTDDPLLDTRLLYSSWVLCPPKLHVYDSCPFCTRARLVLGWCKIPLELEYYRYGEGADPEACGGFGYSPAEGPTKLTGKKSLPVLTGKGLPSRAGFEGLAESMEIMSFGAGVAKEGSVAPATGRADVADWMDRAGDAWRPLVRPRIVKLPLFDWGDERDVEYAKWTNTKDGFDYEEAEAQTSSFVEKMGPLLEELEGMLRSSTEEGAPCLNSWGLSIDDAIVLPVLRGLSCVHDMPWPAKVRAYLEHQCAKAGVPTFFEHAC